MSGNGHNPENKLRFDSKNPSKLFLDSRKDVDEKNDEILLLEQDIEGSRPKRRNNDFSGYNSDSSDDGQTRREKEYEAKLKVEKGNQDDDDDDMFSDSDNDNNNNKESENQSTLNSVKLMDIDSFQKEVGIEDNNRIEEATRVNSDFNQGDFEGDDDEINEENVDIDYFVNPNDDMSKSVSKRTKTHEPKLEGFNLRDDLEDGNFDEDGNFIRNANDENAHQDQWLENISKSEIKKARLAHSQRQNEEESSIEVVEVSSDLMIRLMDNLQIGESPLEALQRLNKLRKTHSKLKGSKRRSKDMSKEDQENEAKIKSKIEDITHCADTLLQKNMSSIYEMSREEIAREYGKLTGESYTLKRKRSRSPDNSDTISDSIKWEFKWDGSDDIYGPYDSPTMKAWFDQQYFDERAKIRQVGSTEFLQYDQVKF